MIYIWDNGQEFADNSIVFYDCELKSTDVIPFLNMKVSEWDYGFAVAVISVHENIRLHIEPLWPEVLMKGKHWRQFGENLMHYTYIMLRRNGLPKGYHKEIELNFFRSYQEMLDRVDNTVKTVAAREAFCGNEVSLNILWDMVIE
jgi:hypothetical protein